MTGMKNLSQILMELANHENWEGYGLLYFAIEYAIQAQPMPASMDKLCRALVGIGGKRNPETIYRSMARAVDDIWARPESRPLLREYYRRDLVEKPTLDSFIAALSRYMWERTSQQPAVYGLTPYQITCDFASQKYGIIIYTGEDSQIWASFPCLTDNLEQLQKIVRFLERRQVSLETFKDFYLSGGLQGLLE